MATISELIRSEADGTISFGNYELPAKSKKSDFERSEMAKEKTGVRLQPENPDFQPIYSDHASILGKVIAVLRYY